MDGQQRACVTVLAAAFVLNVLLCALMIPWLGIMGAAVASVVAIICESVALFLLTKRRLGLHGLVFGKARPQ